MAQTHYKGLEAQFVTELGCVIKRNRKALGLTQSDLAERVGVEPFTVRRWESGARKPGFALLEKLALCFGETADGFLEQAMRAALAAQPER